MHACERVCMCASVCLSLSVNSLTAERQNKGQAGAMSRHEDDGHMQDSGFFPCGLNFYFQTSKVVFIFRAVCL